MNEKKEMHVPFECTADRKRDENSSRAQTGARVQNVDLRTHKGKREATGAESRLPGGVWEAEGGELNVGTVVARRVCRGFPVYIELARRATGRIQTSKG